MSRWGVLPCASAAGAVLEGDLGVEGACGECVDEPGRLGEAGSGRGQHRSSRVVGRVISRLQDGEAHVRHPCRRVGAAVGTDAVDVEHGACAQVMGGDVGADGAADLGHAVVAAPQRGDDDVARGDLLAFQWGQGREGCGDLHPDLDVDVGLAVFRVEEGCAADPPADRALTAPLPAADWPARSRRWPAGPWRASRPRTAGISPSAWRPHDRPPNTAGRAATGGWTPRRRRRAAPCGTPAPWPDAWSSPPGARAGRPPGPPAAHQGPARRAP